MRKVLGYLCTAILLTSCGKGLQDADAHRVFRMNLADGLPSLDPAFARDQASIWMTSQLFCGLVETGTALEIRPLLARSWEITDSGRTYTFHLRTDVAWHRSELFGPDSTRSVNAADVIYSFTRVCNPSLASPGLWVFNGKVEGVDEYREGKAPNISGLTAPDDSTVVIRLRRSFPPFLGQLSMAFAQIVPQEAAEKYGKDFRSHPIGCGPFRFKSWVEGSHLILLRNENYFEEDNGRQLPLLDAVHVRFMSSRVSEFAEFTRGNLDFVNNLDKSVRDEIYEPGGRMKGKYETAFRLQVIPQLNSEYIAILSDSSNALLQGHPLADVRVRQALALCVDRNKLVQYVLNGNGLPATSGLIPAGMPGFDSAAVRGFGYDPARASALLAEAGYPGGKGLPVITLSTTPAYQPVMEFVQKSAARIGITLKTDNMQGSSLREQASNGKLLLWRSGWIADYPDAENYLSLFTSANIPPNGPNRMRYSNPAFNELYASYLLAGSDSARAVIAHEAENLMLRDAPVIPLYYDCVVRLINHDVKGLETNSLNLLYLKRVSKQNP